MTADALITNFLSSGAVLFTLLAADGKPAVQSASVLAWVFCSSARSSPPTSCASSRWAERLTLRRALNKENTKWLLHLKNDDHRRIRQRCICGLNIATHSTIPNVLMAFVIIKMLNISGALTSSVHASDRLWLSSVCQAKLP